MTAAAPSVTRDQILSYQRSVGALDERMGAGAASLRRAAWAGLQDSMPRAAVLSIHARVRSTSATAWADPSLVQVWGPRYQLYVIAAEDVAPFTLGRLPDASRGRRRAEEMAARLRDHLAGRRMGYEEAGRALGVNPNALRYGAVTGTVLLRWEGARRPLVWTAPAPTVDPFAARLELARRHLRVFGPTTAEALATWAGIGGREAGAAYAALAPELVEVRTPLGDRSMLAVDEPALRAPPTPGGPVRLLPSGDAYTLLQGRDRELLVRDADRRALLWTPRVWPGALLIDGEIRGTWRRAAAILTAAPWEPLSSSVRAAVEAEAASLPLPGVDGGMLVRWV